MAIFQYVKKVNVKGSSLDTAPLTILNSGTFYNLGSGS